MILSDEEIFKLITSAHNDCYLPIDFARAIEAKILEKQEAMEPVAKIDFDFPSGIAFTPEGSMLNHGTKLYTHPSPSIPEGWQLVPVIPTPEMLKVANDKVLGSGLWGEGYKAMLKAAPKVKP